MLNPELKKGDRIVLISMDDSYSPSTLELGTVMNASRDPFDDGTIYSVKWDDGSQLNLLSNVDIWMKEEDYNKRTKK